MGVLHVNLFEIPGCTFIGFIQAENVNNGQPVPLFSPEPPPGKTDINTMEGWNKLAEKQNLRAFRAAHCRDPINESELREWVYSLI